MEQMTETNFSPDVPNDDGLDAFAFEGVAEITEAEGAASDPVASGMLGPDEFFTMFRALVGAPNILLYARGVEPLQSLQVADNDLSARAASDAIYDTCRDVPALRFLIQPGNIWAQRALVVGAWGFGLVGGVRAEIVSRRAAVAAARAANDNAVDMEAVG